MRLIMKFSKELKRLAKSNEKKANIGGTSFEDALKGKYEEIKKDAARMS